MKEILVHLSAPTSRKDDERYRRLVEAYDEFEPISTTDSATRTGAGSSVDSHTSDAPLHVGPGTLASHDLTHSAARGGPFVSRASQTASVIGFRAPAKTAPSTRSKGKRLELFAQAPDFGSFTSSPRTPLQQLHEIERRWLHQERSSTKRSASRLSKTNTSGNTPSKDAVPLFIEDTQEALASLEDHIESSSFGGWPSSSQSPELQKPSKRPRLSPTQQSPEASQSQNAKKQASGLHPTPNNLSPPSPPRDSNSSRMPDSYNLGNSQSSTFYGSYPSEPVFESMVGPDRNAGSGLSQDGRSSDDQCQLQSSVAESSAQENTVTSLSQQSQSATAEKPQESRAHEPSLVEQMATHSQVPVVDAVPQPENSDFASLPLQLWSKPEAVGEKQEFNEVTSMLKTYVSKASIAKHYRPASVSRTIGIAERGCWMFDTADWETKRQHEFWTRMQYMLGEGYFGNVWCQRNVPKDWRSGGTDGNEKEGLGMVWLFCWGQVVPHIWVVLLVESHLEIRKSKAQWTVGPMEKLEVVVQML